MWEFVFSVGSIICVDFVFKGVVYISIMFYVVYVKNQ